MNALEAQQLNLQRLRDECLNPTLFGSLPQARAELKSWRSDDNGGRSGVDRYH